tara:strand:+ start:1237 stop:2139 length:903 start_codon:yes stop_codon:yes gene_type:complete
MKVTKHLKLFFMKRNIIICLYYPFRILNAIKKLLLKDTTRVRVLLFHDIPPEQHNEFQRKLEFLSLTWDFITPEEFGLYLDNKLTLTGDNLLLSFDDGFYSNRVVAEKILNTMGIKALFFVVSEFVKITKKQEEIEFIKNNLYPEWRKHTYPAHIEEMRSLSYEDLKYLDEQGHSIGCHTATHQDMSKILDPSVLRKEIIDSANEIETLANITIEHFSYGFGHASFFNKDALMMAKERFPYIHTAMRGDNAKDKIPWAIKRDAIALEDPLYLMTSFLEGIADFRYKKHFAIYESWNNKNV